MPKYRAWTVASCLLLLTAGPGRADPIWQVRLRPDERAVTSDGGSGGIIFLIEDYRDLHEGSNQILFAFSTLSQSPDTFSGQTIHLKALFADMRGDHETLSFLGHLFGSLTQTTADLTITYDTPTLTETIGNHAYTVTPPTHLRVIDQRPLYGLAEVRVESVAAPEPSALMLTATAALGGLLCRRRKRDAATEQ
jgi:hypothetical protein